MRAELLSAVRECCVGSFGVIGAALKLHISMKSFFCGLFGDDIDDTSACVTAPDTAASAFDDFDLSDIFGEQVFDHRPPVRSTRIVESHTVEKHENGSGGLSAHEDRTWLTVAPIARDRDTCNTAERLSGCLIAVLCKISRREHCDVRCSVAYRLLALIGGGDSEICIPNMGGSIESCFCSKERRER